eukprot:Nk52_evm5s228 gene=Nk52_evmTU5s228
MTLLSQKSTQGPATSLSAAGLVAKKKKALEAARAANEKKLTKTVLKYPKSAQAVDGEGNTLLHLCIDSMAKYGMNSAHIVDILVSRGANPYLFNKQGQSAVDLAVEHNLDNLVKIMTRSSTGSSSTHAPTSAEVVVGIQNDNGNTLRNDQNEHSAFAPSAADEKAATTGQGRMIASFPEERGSRGDDASSSEPNRLIEFRAKLFELIEGQFCDLHTGMLKVGIGGTLIFVNDVNEVVLMEALQEIGNNALRGETVLYEIVNEKNVKLLLKKSLQKPTKVYLFRLKETKEAEKLYRIIHKGRAERALLDA